MPDPDPIETKAREAARIAGAELAAGLHARQSAGAPLERLPIPDRAGVEARAALGSRLCSAIEALGSATVPADAAIDLELVRVTAARWRLEASHFDLVHDPLGLGFFSLFGPGAYGGGWFIGTALGAIARMPTDTAEERARVLERSRELAGAVRAMRTRLIEQANRGIRIPRPQLPKARQLITGLVAQVRDRVRPDAYQTPAHMDQVWSAALSRTGEDVVSALGELGAILDADYESASSDEVGLGRYPGGAALYEQLVRHYTTLDLTPEAVEARGRERLREIHHAMAGVRDELRFTGSNTDLQRAIDADPRWRATEPDAIARCFQRARARLDELLPRLFRRLPASQDGVAPLPAALQASMTYGFYQVPTAPGQPGRYLFNAANLAAGGLAHVPALTYHELMPGHHLHFARQLEDESLGAVRRHNSFNAFNEGWAEYAATLAGELGLYECPEERFGRLRMDAFLTCRLIVDTGLNTGRLTLEAARQFLREHAFMPESEIESETLRYACDLPGQALAYKLGDTHLLGLRERMRSALGSAFELADFHEAVLAPGALPLSLVTREVERAIAARRDAAHRH